jgi:hypothetical protein
MQTAFFNISAPISNFLEMLSQLDNRAKMESVYSSIDAVFAEFFGEHISGIHPTDLQAHLSGRVVSDKAKTSNFDPMLLLGLFMVLPILALFGLTLLRGILAYVFAKGCSLESENDSSSDLEEEEESDEKSVDDSTVPLRELAQALQIHPYYEHNIWNLTAAIEDLIYRTTDGSFRATPLLQATLGYQFGEELELKEPLRTRVIKIQDAISPYMELATVVEREQDLDAAAIIAKDLSKDLPKTVGYIHSLDSFRELIMNHTSGMCCTCGCRTTGTDTSAIIEPSGTFLAALGVDQDATVYWLRAGTVFRDKVVPMLYSIIAPILYQSNTVNK